MLPSLPQPKDGPGGQATQTGQDMGPILPVPPEIRPTLVKYRYNCALYSVPVYVHFKFVFLYKFCALKSTRTQLAESCKLSYVD